MSPRPTSHGRLVEVDTVEQFDALVAAGARSMVGWRVQDLDLTGRSAALRRLDPTGALLLGCTLTPADEDSLRDRGALLFPDVPGLLFDPYRTTLYSPAELYEGVADGYEHTTDARIYAWSRRFLAPSPSAPRQPAEDVAATLAQALHDHAVDDALSDFASGRRLVGVMGGHDLPRDSQGYAEAALLGQRLGGAGLTVSTGGGPGAMEAANLGAVADGIGAAELQAAVRRLGRFPDYRPSVTGWARSALEVLRDLTEDPGGDPDGSTGSLGVPTWFYGHEPPNVFATSIAKYFRNALREDTLLQVCSAGIVFLPGAGGTVQEIFQDACENYYAEPGARAPMVLVGRSHWTERFPAWPLLSRMAEERGFRELVSLVDTWEEVPDILSA